MLDTSNNNPFAPYEHSPAIMFPIASRRVAFERRIGWEPLSTHKAIIREYRGEPKVLSVVSDTYKVVHNHELFTHVEKVLINEIMPDNLDGVQVKDKVAHFGRTCIREYVFPKLRCDIGAKSDIGFRLIVSNAYGGASIRILAGAIEFYCTNGLVIGQYESAYVRHTSGLQVERIGDNVADALKKYAGAQLRWSRWTQTPVTREQTMAFFHEIASSPRMLDKFVDHWAEERDDRGSNLWSVYSTLTHYATHEDKWSVRRTENDSNAATMLSRELDVRRWIELPAFREMENA